MTANDIEATIIVVASGYPRGLFQFTGPPTVSVTRQQSQVSMLLPSLCGGVVNQ